RFVPSLLLRRPRLAWALLAAAARKPGVDGDARSFLDESDLLGRIVEHNPERLQELLPKVAIQVFIRQCALIGFREDHTRILKAMAGQFEPADLARLRLYHPADAALKCRGCLASIQQLVFSHRR